MEGAETWVEEYERGDNEVKVALLLGKRSEDIADEEVGLMGSCWWSCWVSGRGAKN